MAGEAVTQSFMLATATVMIGEQSQLYNLNPADHSIGLVKNFQITGTPSFVDMTQGVTNNVVYSVMNANKVTAQMEVYEYTSRNLSYALGLDGGSLTAYADTYTLHTALAGTDAAAVAAVPSDESSQFPAGTWIMIQDPAFSDRVHVTTTSGAPTYSAGPPSTLSLPLTHETGWTNPISVGGRVSRINKINVGNKNDQPYFGAKIVGVMPDDNEPVIIMIPKVRITKGFTVSFATNQFGNLPLEFELMDLVSSDPNYSEFAANGTAFLLTRS